MERLLLLLDELEDAALVAGTLGARPAWRRRSFLLLAACLLLAVLLL